MKDTGRTTYEPTALRLNPYPKEVVFVWSQEELDALVQWMRRSDNDDYKEYAEYLEKHKLETYGETHTSGTELFSVVAINLSMMLHNGEKDSTIVSVIAHEVFHIVMELGHQIGQYPMYSHDEPMAYMTSYIMKHALTTKPMETEVLTGKPVLH